MFFQMSGSNHRNCAVPYCTEGGTTLKNGTVRSFFSWPQEKLLSKTWEFAIRRDIGPNFNASKYTRVCSLHFKEEEIMRTLTGKKKLKPGAVPSVFKWTMDKKVRPPPRNRTVFPYPHERDDAHETESTEDNGTTEAEAHDKTEEVNRTDDLQRLQDQIDSLQLKLQENEGKILVKDDSLQSLKEELSKIKKENGVLKKN